MPTVPGFIHSLCFPVNLFFIKIRLEEQVIVVFPYFASLSLLTFNKNAGICCCFITLQPACFSLFFVRCELAWVRLR